MATVIGVSAARPVAVTVASVLVMATGVAFLVGAGVSLGAGHAGFSAGVSAMLALYGLLVAGIGVMLWRRVALGFGLGVALSLLHLLAFTSLAHGHWAWPLLVAAAVSLATLVLLLLPRSRRALGHA